ncbi:putative late blight resistance protein homolog R1B-16 [Salvia splendens]|uniref:putative late blight resistance protein homolog R1B-16 n=1 Tax=Salvia splendens TaxID=180675 RepID=UPI001C27D88B|nr:putative late blight resistance protein homolog R1B-16 [Salvia splendens]XP_042024557.1 putative late blight resistance protein homolog R1B-16 [Salvia splendens]XP_042024558.1 putative late blight resistance protein homolog R1B-16 [Salvia splendens]
MAYAALLSALQALKKATQQDFISNLFSIKHQITILDEKFCFLRDFLENDPPPASRDLTHILEGRIREAAYRAEDIIDFHIQNQIVPVPVPLTVSVPIPVTVKTSYWRTLSAFWRFLSLSDKQRRIKDFRADNCVKLCHVRADSCVKLYQEFQKVVDEVESILQQVELIKESREFESLHMNDHHPTGDADDVGCSRITPMAMVGFDDEMVEIKNQLCGGSSSLKIVSFVGMAGIGKTTLATNLFHDPLIEYHFHVRSWTTLSQDHQRPNILRSLLRSMTENLGLGLEEVDELVYKSLKGRRYLIVLDDMWSIEAWDDVKMLFPDDHNGSRVIITTRLADVAAYTNSGAYFHQMKFLNDEQSWDLLRGKVFEEDCPDELESVGKWIASNCRGLPLSIIVVAGLLKMDMRKHQWENIGRDVSLAVTEARGEEEEDERLPWKILSLSYNHLPHHLKPCFLSMAAFPEDYQIPVFNLITLWVAEGFLKPLESKSLEQAGEEYLEDLVNRSLVLVTMEGSNRKPRLCSIHDLLRDLCVKKAQEEKFLHPMIRIQESMKHKRRLWFSKSVECLHFKSAIATNPPARSVFCCSYKGEVLNGFNQLKILHILEVNFESFPCEILQLRRLKFIAFSSGFIRYCTLPPSLPKLEHLQSLIVSSSVKFSPHEYRAVAPLPIWDMPQLRHLVFLNITLSPAYGVLENLQTLSRVRNFIFSREAIERLPNLKRLKAIYTGHDPSLYELGNLIHLDKLETLNLFFAPSSRMERVEGVRFGVPLGIKKLTLGGCGISWEEMRGMIGSLVNLEVLKLEYLSVVGEEWVAVEGDFPMLKFLLMERLDLRCWMAEGVDFPSLQRLIIRHCSRLEGIPCGVGEIPTLEVIEVDHCTPMAADSAREILEEQVSMGNDALHVRVSPH